jgi:hypothetical protein
MSTHPQPVTTATVPSTAGDPDTAGALDIFISYCSREPLAGRLFELIRTTVYGGNDEETTRRVFYSGHVDASLPPGGKFDEMLKRLERSTCVVAIVTRQTMNSTAMLSEMAVANAAKKLIPALARESYRHLLTWPFAETQGSMLDSESGVQQLLTTIGAKIGRPATFDAAAKEKCRELAAQAKRTHRPVAPPWRSWLLAAALLAITVGIAGYWFGSREKGPRLVAIDGTPIDGIEIRTVHQSTLPRKRLSSRLHELRQKLGPSTETSEVHNAFMDVLTATNSQWGFSDETLKKLRTIVEEWKSGDSKIEYAGRLDCNDMPIDVDKKWCAALEAEIPAKLDDFDNTVYAIARIGTEVRGRQPPPVVMTTGKQVPGHRTWIVQGVNTVLLRIDK